MKTIVTTTIHTPFLLEEYCKDIISYEHKDVNIIVVSDLKTPVGAKGMCEYYADRYGVPIEFMDVEAQRQFLQPAEDYLKFLPWNCIQRRNVGILKAYFDGAEIIYTIDDDNFLHTPNYIGSHRIDNIASPIGIVGHESGWFNICSYLKEKQGKKFFHRGFSLKARSKDLTPAIYPELGASFRSEVEKRGVEPGSTRWQFGKCVVSAGLWLGDPDVDAVTRLAIAPDVVSSEISTHVALEIGVKGPFNSQNTALHRSVIPAYCLAAGIGRYDDIIASYIVKRIADHLGEFICFGQPLVHQKRNSHNLFKDYAEERLGLQLIDRIVESLYEAPLKGNSYSECIQELIPKFFGIVSSKTQSDEELDFCDLIRINYEQFGKAMSDLTGVSP